MQKKIFNISRGGIYTPLIFLGSSMAEERFSYKIINLTHILGSTIPT